VTAWWEIDTQSSQPPIAGRDQQEVQESTPARNETTEIQDQSEIMDDLSSTRTPIGETLGDISMAEDEIRRNLDKEIEEKRNEEMNELRRTITLLQAQIAGNNARVEPPSERPMRERFSSCEPEGLRDLPTGVWGLFYDINEDPYAIPAHNTRFSKPSGRNRDEDHDHDMKCPPPLEFEGEAKKVEEWLMSCQIHFDLRQRTFSSERVKVLMAVSRMRGEAALWICPYMELPFLARPAFFAEFRLFRRAVKEQWPVENEAASARQALDRLRQTGKAADYLSKFSIHAPYTGYDDAALINFAKNGLKQDLFIAVKEARDAPQTFSRWKHWVINFDNIRCGGLDEQDYYRIP
jgi:hypothetical protein